jgi:NTE family protein
VARVLPAGLFDNRGLDEMMRRLFDAPGRSNDFRALRHRLYLIATDLDSGAAVAFGSAGREQVPISTAVQASAALPGLYPPVPIDGRWYVDGALTKTLHASVALKEGAQLVICVNPLVPYNAPRAAELGHHHERQLVNGGLPVVLAQTFRTIIHSRLQVGIAKYEHEYKDADVLLFEPSPDDDDMFFTNMFSYAGRQWLSEHAYHRTRRGAAASPRRAGPAAGAPRHPPARGPAARPGSFAAPRPGRPEAPPRRAHGPHRAAAVGHAG